MKCESLNDVSKETKDLMEVLILREVYGASELCYQMSSNKAFWIFRMPKYEYDLMDEDSEVWFSLTPAQKVASQGWDAMRSIYALLMENEIPIEMDEFTVWVPVDYHSLMGLSGKLLRAIKPRLYY